MGCCKQNNPILIGEAGVGRTAIAEGLALLIARGDVNKKLKGKKVIIIKKKIQSSILYMNFVL